ncbi:hypothetical protein NL676_000595 [Syzygium grande]|nr:hypothetical protein NL676_000595 [Syzygium grande]
MAAASSSIVDIAASLPTHRRCSAAAQSPPTPKQSAVSINDDLLLIYYSVVDHLDNMLCPTEKRRPQF